MLKFVDMKTQYANVTADHGLCRAQPANVLLYVRNLADNGAPMSTPALLPCNLAAGILG